MNLYKKIFITKKLKKMAEYNKIWIFISMCVLLAVAILSLSVILKSRNFNIEKVSAYECGFQPFEDTRNRFDVKFYLVAILFIIFDIEIIYLFPWGLAIDEIYLEGIVSMLIFLSILTIGFVYEWKKGALDWY